MRSNILMNFLSVLALLPLSVVRAAPAAAAAPGDLPAGVLHFPLTRRGVESYGNLLQRRADSVNVDINNRETLFTTELQIGSTGQKVSVQVDTGSSDLWVMDTDNPYCSSILNGSNTMPGPKANNLNPQWRVECQASAMFNPHESSSYSKNNTDFTIRYGDGSFANGTYGHDDISFGGATIRQANFAIAQSANSTTAVWGIGYEATEAIVRTVDQNGVYSPTYANIPAQMKQQGLIEANAYSLWLNDLNAKEGSLLFGGVDHARYTGSLQTVPVVSTYQGISNPNELRVMVHSISLYQGNNNATIVECSLPFLLDSGTSFMMVPGQFLAPLIESIGAVYSEQGYTLVPCDLNGGLIFDLSGVQIQIPFSELLLSNTGVPNTCALGIMDGGDSLILGDTFLRSVYVVYDLDNNEVALARPAYNVSSSSVEAISSSIPSATQAPSYSSTQVRNSIVASPATFFSNSAASGRSGGVSNGYGSFTTTLFSETGSFTGLSTHSLQGTGGALQSARKNNAPHIQRQSVLGSAVTGMLGLLLYL